LRACPTVRNEKHLATLSSSSNGNLSIQRWNGQTKTWALPDTLATIATADTAYRPFDIAYEQNTGRAIVAYRSTNTGRVYYRVWSSTAGVSGAWVRPQTELVMGGTGLVRWVRLEPRPGTNEIMLVTMDANNDIYAYRWDGSSWVNNKTVTTSGISSTNQTFDVAWETTRGNCLIVYGERRALKYTMWQPGTSAWLASAVSITIGIGGNNPGWVKLAADRQTSSNRLGFTINDSVSAWYGGIWDGSIWTSYTFPSVTLDNITTRPFDIAWEKTTGKCIVSGIVSATPAQYVTYATWMSGTWSNPLVTYSGYNLGNSSDLRWLQMTPDPNSNRVVLLGSNADVAGAVSLRTINWTGAYWTGGVSISTWSATNAYEFFSLALDRHDVVSPTYEDNQDGDNTWRKENSGTYSVTFQDTGGSYLSRVQTRLFDQDSTLYRDWTDELSGLNTESYTANWTLTSTSWDQLRRGKSFVSLKVLDGVGNDATCNTPFYVLKDTEPPTIATSNAITGWQTANPTNIIDINFSDQEGLSLLTSAQFLIYPQPARGGPPIKAATQLFSYAGTATKPVSFSLSAADWELLANSTNYVTLECYDVAGNTCTAVDAFVVLKDTIPPQAVTTLGSSKGPFRGTIDLSWMAPGDDNSAGNNGEGSYLIKYATYPITTQAEFVSATTYYHAPVPLPAKSLQTLTIITDLDVTTTYYFALRTKDKASQWSDISNSTESLPADPAP
jgi:hypothetical protein